MWRCGWLDGGARGEVGDEAGGEGRLGGGEVEEVEFGRLEDEIEMKEEVGTVFTLGSAPVTPMCDPVWFEDSHETWAFPQGKMNTRPIVPASGLL